MTLLKLLSHLSVFNPKLVQIQISKTDINLICASFLTRQKVELTTNMEIFGGGVIYDDNNTAPTPTNFILMGPKALGQNILINRAIFRDHT